MKTRKLSPLVSGVKCAFLIVMLLFAPVQVRAHLGIDEQIKDLTTRIGATPTRAELYVRRAELHRLHRDWAAAEADLRQAAELDAELPEVDLQLGDLLLDIGKPDEARKKLDAYIAARPESGRGHATRARAEGQLGLYLAAAADWTRAIELATNGLAGPGYYLERARALVAAGPEHIDAAVRGLDAGMAALGNPVTLQLHAIDLEVQRERWNAALERLDRIAALSQRQETWLLRRGEILEQAGRRPDALAAYRKALEAIDSLPPGRRQTRAMQRVATAAQGAVTRLTNDS